MHRIAATRTQFTPRPSYSSINPCYPYITNLSRPLTGTSRISLVSRQTDLGRFASESTRTSVQSDVTHHGESDATIGTCISLFVYELERRIGCTYFATLKQQRVRLTSQVAGIKTRRPAVTSFDTTVHVPNHHHQSDRMSCPVDGPKIRAQPKSNVWCH